MKHRRCTPCLAIGIALTTVVFLRAHLVPVEQRVEVRVRMEDRQLRMRMHIPIAAVPAANLPQALDGGLTPDVDPAALQVVAADTIRNIDVQQDGEPLPTPEFSARSSSDRSAIDVDITYHTADSVGLSARLNAFRGGELKPVRTVLTVEREGGGQHEISVSGPATRVLLDPTVSEAARRTTTFALTRALSWSDHVLLIVCLLLPLLSAASVGRLAVTVFAAQAIGMVGALAVGTPPVAASVASALSASAVVVSAIQVIVRARPRFVTAVAAFAGLTSGVAIAAGLASGELQFAGAHRGAAAFAFVLVWLCAEAWLIAVLWSTRGWLATRGLPERGFGIVAAAFVAHTAVHHVMEQESAIAASGGWLATHALLAITLAWALVMLAVALAAALAERGAIAPVPSSPHD
jgi:hypothetical protein